MRPEARPQSIDGLKAVHHNLGNLQNSAGRFTEAESSWRKAVELSAQIFSKSPGSPGSKNAYASEMDGLAETLVFQRKWNEAEKTLREAIRIQEPLAADLPEDQGHLEDLAVSLCMLGEVLNNLDRRSEAEKELRRSIEISRDLIARAPKLIFRRVITAKALLLLAEVEAHNGHREASKSLVADARTHVKVGLAINPLDPDLNKVKVEIEESAKGKIPGRDLGITP